MKNGKRFAIIVIIYEILTGSENFEFQTNFPRQLSVLCHYLFFFCFSTGVFSQVLSIYLTGIGKTTTEMTFIISSSNLFGIALIPIFGFIVDRVKKPYMIMGTMLAAGVLSLIFAVSRNTWVLLNFMGCFT